jgi:hypothetical protein
MEHVKYIILLLTNKSSKSLINWFKLKNQKNMYENICSNYCVIKIINNLIDKSTISDYNIGKNGTTKVVGFIDNNTDQVALITYNGRFYQICISTKNNIFDISKYSVKDFKECDGPYLEFDIAFINLDNEIKKEIQL